MLFMVIERFRNNDAAAVYRRFRGKGRMLPDGLKYVDVAQDFRATRAWSATCGEAPPKRLATSLADSARLASSVGPFVCHGPVALAARLQGPGPPAGPSEIVEPLMPTAPGASRWPSAGSRRPTLLSSLSRATCTRKAMTMCSRHSPSLTKSRSISGTANCGRNATAARTGWRWNCAATILVPAQLF
jgi:hypothetical protein